MKSKHRLNAPETPFIGVAGRNSRDADGDNQRPGFGGGLSSEKVASAKAMTQPQRFAGAGPDPIISHASATNESLPQSWADSIRVGS